MGSCWMPHACTGPGKVSAAVVSAGLTLVVFFPQLGAANNGSAVCKADVQSEVTFETLCGPPLALTNFQGNASCPPDLQLARTSTLEELQDIVKSYDKVKAVGTGSSWHPDLFCSGSGPDAIAVFPSGFTALDPLFEEYSDGGRLNASDFDPDADNPSFPIQVDLEAMTVTVAAGLTQRVLLEYLISYGEEGGYYLGSTSGWVGQTIGGALAYGVHGSSFIAGSLSQQVTAMEVVLADGTVQWFSAEADPHLFRALRVSLGRLGVITRVTFPIFRQPVYARETLLTSQEEHVAQVAAISDGYNAAKGDPARLEEFYRGLDGIQMVWNPTTGFSATTKLTRLPEGTPPVYQGSYDYVSGGASEFDPVTGAIAMLPAFAEGSPALAALIDQALLVSSSNATNLPAYEALYATSRQRFSSANTASSYSCFEAAIPLGSLANCTRKMFAFFESDRSNTNGFVDANLYRFGRQEDGYLAYGPDGPVAWINFNAYFNGPDGRLPPNQQKLMRLFKDECGARFHWGKNGWQDTNACFNGADTFPTTWCHFGCAAKQLDPGDKFTGLSPIWSWQAEMAGKPVEFTECCSLDKGFDYGRCTCKSPRPGCEMPAVA